METLFMISFGKLTVFSKVLRQAVTFYIEWPFYVNKNKKFYLFQNQSIDKLYKFVLYKKTVPILNLRYDRLFTNYMLSIGM